MANTTDKDQQEKSVSLSVEVPKDGSKDIHVEVKRKPSPGKRRSQRRFTTFIVVVILLMLVPIARTIFSYFKLKAELEVVKKENQELVLQQKELQERITALEDPETIAKIAREQLGLVKEGEVVVIPSIPNEDIPENEEIKPGEQLH